jgi:hypothetical protein
VNLEEELEQLPVADLRGIEYDFDRFGVPPVIAICRIRHVTTRVPNARRDHARVLAQKFLDPPKATAGQNRAFLL